MQPTDCRSDAKNGKLGLRNERCLKRTLLRAVGMIVPRHFSNFGSWAILPIYGLNGAKAPNVPNTRREHFSGYCVRVENTLLGNLLWRWYFREKRSTNLICENMQNKKGGTTHPHKAWHGN
jgi:hypothetical protein